MANHTQPCPPGKLDRIGADISGGAVDQNALATSKTRLFEQRLPGGDSHDRNGGGLDVAKPRRLLSDHTGGDSRKFGIGADKARIGDAREVRAESQRQRLRQGALARRIQASQGPTPTALTRTKTSLSPGSSRFMSSR